METKILGLSGKKQSGKNTSANYVVGLFLRSLKITDTFSITDKGELAVRDIFGNTDYAGIIDLNSRHPSFLEFASEHIFPFIKLYSYADLLKQNVCIDILGLTFEQCFGTNEQKDSLTHLKWENMPGIYTNKKAFRDTIEANPELNHPDLKRHIISYHDTGYMTGRDVMQYVGTEIFRKMYNNVWAEATIKQIQRDNPIMGIITDVRFVNEVQSIKNLDNGIVVRFTRNINQDTDQHESEIALDNYPLENYDFVMHNQHLTITEQNELLHNYLASRELIKLDMQQELANHLQV